MSEEPTQHLPPGYRVQDGCLNCKHFRELPTYEEFDGYCAAVEPAPQHPLKDAKPSEWKRWHRAVDTRRIEMWATCDHWEPHA